jgi:hypothetical protein
MMRRIIFYFLAIVLGAWGTLAILRGFELLFTGTLTAYGAGSLFGSFVMGPLLLFAAWKAFAHARKSSRAESQNNR